MKKIIGAAVMALAFLPVFSQDASVLTDILNREKASYIDFSYLIASELGMDGSAFEAYTYCDRFGNFRFTDSADKPIRVKNVSHFLVGNYGIKGGLMWSAFGSPRYAYKELKNSGFWDSNTDPDSTLSGRDLVRAISRFFAMYPDAVLSNPSLTEAAPAQRQALLVEKETTK